MTRAIVDQKLSALLSAEARLHRALERRLECGALADAYRKAEDEYNEAFDAWWHSPPGGVVPEPSETLQEAMGAWILDRDSLQPSPMISMPVTELAASEKR